MASMSSGLLLYRVEDGVLEVWIAHMGGPFWARKDAGAWSIPKGELDDAEDPLGAALREFAEEMGVPAPDAPYELLGRFPQSRKVVTIFIAEADFAIERVVSNTFALEWPPRSGRSQEFPEVDRAAWYAVAVAREKLVAGQRPALDALVELLSARGRAFRVG